MPSIPVSGVRSALRCKASQSDGPHSRVSMSSKSQLASDRQRLQQCIAGIKVVVNSDCWRPPRVGRSLATTADRHLCQHESPIPTCSVSVSGKNRGGPMGTHFPRRSRDKLSIRDSRGHVPHHDRSMAVSLVRTIDISRRRKYLRQHPAHAEQLIHHIDSHSRSGRTTLANGA